MRAAIVAAMCVPVVAACATGFGSPTRHAIANLQAASVDVSSTLKIDGLIIALPNGSSADKGDVAYIQFNATNLSSQGDELQNASVEASAPASASGPASGAASTAPASGSPSLSSVASQVLPVGSTTVPPGSPTAPGTARIVVALMSLTQPLSQGESVHVSLQFASGSAVDDVLVPVQGDSVVGSSFLPSAPPSLPGYESASAPASVPASAPASAPASSAPGSSAPESQTPSVSPSPTSSS